MTVGGGQASVDGTLLATTGTHGPGRSIEFVATFGAAAFQHAGLGQNLASESGESWAMFSTWNTSAGLFARTNNNGTVVNTPIAGNYLGSSHRYRIDWGASSVVFSIDGTVVHIEPVAIGASMRPIVSDFDAGGQTVGVDYMRMSPYTSPGTFLSRIHNAGAPGADWGVLSYVADVPSGTTLELEVSTGDTPTPDGSWSSFAPIASGEEVASSGRYLQYQVQATSSAGLRTPTLQSVTLAFTATPDTTPPTITGRTPAPDATGVPIGTDVTVMFDEPMDPSTITDSTFTLRAQGAGADVPATVSYAGTTATLDPSADLDTNTPYTVTVAASVTDTSGNELVTADTWTFTTSTGGATDTTVADFGAGTTGANTYVSETGNGEVILAPTVGAEFSGTGLPSDWSSTLWAGGSGGSTIADGTVTLDQALLATDLFYTPGRSLEFAANFSDPNQHIGFANDFNNGQWAIFSTGQTGDQLYARSLVPGGTDTPLGATYLDGVHRYRIEWTPSQVRYLIDGEEVALHDAVAYSQNLRPAASDSNASGSLAIDWMRMSPYTSPGTFLSRIHNAGAPGADWGALSYVADVPSGTTLELAVRTGDTPTPDGSWSPFAPIVSGEDVASSGRYLQYRAQAPPRQALLPRRSNR